MNHESFIGEFIFLYSITLTVIVTIAYIEGLLNDFLHAAVAIISCAVDVIFGDIFLHLISRARVAIARRITGPIQASIKWIPHPIKAVFIICAGAGILYLDHIYNTKIFAEDETTFYKFIVYDKTYWVTEYAAYIGGAVFGFGLVYLFQYVVQRIHFYFDKRIRIQVLIRR